MKFVPTRQIYIYIASGENWIVTGVCVVASAVVIVCTAGTATPFVVAGISAISGAVMSGTQSITNQWVQTGDLSKTNWLEVGKDALIGGATGFVTGYAGSVVGGVITSKLASTAIVGSLINSTSVATRTATQFAIGSMSEVAAGTVSRFAGTMVSSGFDLEKSAQSAFDGKSMLFDGVLGGVSNAVSGIKAPNSVETLNNIDDVFVGSNERANTKGYSNFADGMSQEDAVKYISNNEEKFYIEFSERASAAGLSSTQIYEAYSAMKSGDYSKMASYFNTASPYDGAVFWSGNKIAAGEYAKSIGGTLMEQTTGGKVFDDWRGLQGMYTDWGTGTSFDQKPIWEALSSQYANGANGAVTYVHPDGYYGNVWKNTELPILNERLEDGLINNIQEVIIDGE